MRTLLIICLVFSSIFAEILLQQNTKNSNGASNCQKFSSDDQCIMCADGFQLIQGGCNKKQIIQSSSNYNPLNSCGKPLCIDDPNSVFLSYKELKQFVDQYYPVKIFPQPQNSPSQIQQKLEEKISIQTSKKLSDEQIRLQKKLPQIKRATYIIPRLTNISSNLPKRQYSQTFAQDPNVNEGNNIITDGTYIYTISNQIILIIRAFPPFMAKVVSKINISPFNPSSLVVFSHYLAVFGYTYEDITKQPNTFIKIFNLRDITAPVLYKNLFISGEPIQQFRILKNGFVYLTTKFYLNNNIIFPWYDFGQGKVRVPSTSIFKFKKDFLKPFIILIAGINLGVPQSPQKKVIGIMTELSFPVLYMTERFIYLMCSFQNKDQQFTNIKKIQIYRNAIKPWAESYIEGQIQNRLFVNEKDNNLRVVVQVNEELQLRYNKVYILNHNLKLLGFLTKIAPLEKIKTCSFMKNRLYLTTKSQQLNKIIIITLKNLQQPKILAKYNSSLLFDYFQPYDQSKVIGIGLDNTIKVIIYDFSSPQNTKLSQAIIKQKFLEQSPFRSSITSIPQSVLFLPIKNLLVFPVSIDNQLFGRFNGVLIFYGADFEPQVINHLDKNEQSFYSSSVSNSFYIDSYLYSFSDCKIKINQIPDFFEVKTINIECPKVTKVISQGFRPLPPDQNL